MSKADDPPGNGDASQAGRGVIYIGLAKIYFIVAGLSIELVLPAILGNVLFGAYGFVAQTVSMVNNVLVTGSIQAVSRFTAQQPALARPVQAAGLRMQLGLGLPVALAFMLGAPIYAHFVHDPSKIGLLVLGGAIIAGNAFYAVFVGTANGTRAFHKQAGLDMSFATLRAMAILGTAFAGLGLYGTIGGWVGAVFVILALAAVVVGVPGRASGTASGAQAGAQPIRPLAVYFLSVAGYLILLNLIMAVDVPLLKRFATEWFAAHPDLLAATAHAPGIQDIAVPLSPASAADGQIGYYRVVQNLARLSYQVIIAGMFVVFPLISRSTFENDRETTRRYIHTTMRYSLIFATGVGAVMAANPGPMIDVLYRPEYAHFGAPALIALALGNVAFCLFAIAGTILNGAGRTLDAIVVAAVTLVAAVLANVIMVPLFAPGRAMLLATATATGSAMVIGAALGGLYLVRRFGAFVPWPTLVRVLLAVGVGVGVGRLVPFTSTLLTLVEALIVGATYLTTLVLTRELTRRDLAAVASLRRRKPAATQRRSEP
ncbi:MAG TPA: polysaccharide biosynthesis C-terminal domain-containing protein [Haliangium sp.]|nr:polysaccharide biosynthesis C-terminal domain-containing protein [Haliangium sp.]